MVRNRRIASLGVISLLATIMTALALIVNNPAADGDSEHVGTEAVVFAENNGADEKAPPYEGETGIGGEDVDNVNIYLLKDTSGFIGIYTLDDPDTPKEVTEIVTGKLRRADAEMLKEGIVARGEEELAKLLEDFGS